jgi:hypothetical protein
MFNDHHLLCRQASGCAGDWIESRSKLWDSVQTWSYVESLKLAAKVSENTISGSVGKQTTVIMTAESGRCGIEHTEDKQ